MKKSPNTVTGYIVAAPKQAQAMLKQLRAAIRSAAPQAQEKISYGMPYYGYQGRLAYFAAFRDHVSYFIIPSHSISQTFAHELKRYQTSKSTLRFPIGTKVPTALIKRIVKAQMKQNEAREGSTRRR